MSTKARGMHIAYVCADRGVPVGGHKGASLHVAELVRALGRCGAEVQVLGARVAETAAGALDGAAIVDAGDSRAARRAREAMLRAPGAGQSPAQAAEAAAVLFNQDLARVLERLHKQWRIDAIYERYSLWSFAAAGFARAHGIPFLLEVNAPLREEQKRYRSLENEALAASLERYVLGCADRVLVPSRVLLPYVTAHGATRQSACVVPNGADPARFRPVLRRKAQAHKKPGEFVIGFVGSLKPWHGLSDLARAFRRLHRSHEGYRLLVVGDGPLRAELEEELRRYGVLDAATLTGAAAHERVPELVATMDVALAPYPRDAPTYFSPIKIFEYMAAGVPIVASRVGQIAEVLSHRRTAMLHAPGAIAEIAAHIEELRRRPALAKRLAERARERAASEYTWKSNAARVVSMIGEVRRAQQRAEKAAASPVRRRSKRAGR